MSPVLSACTFVLALQVHQAAAAQVNLGKKISERAILVTSPKSLLQEIEEIARAGEAPASDKVNDIKKIVNDELKPDLQKTHKAAVDLVAANLGSISTCNSASVTRSSEIKAATEVSVGEARAAHTTCREGEKTKHETRGNRCGELDTFLDTINEPSNLPKERPRAGMVEYVQTMSNYFCPKGPEVTTLNRACDEAEAERAKHKAECDRKQSTFEAGFCSWRTELVDNCDTLSKCYTRAVKAYTDHKTETTELVTKWKLEWAALDKIDCYLDVWLSDSDTSTANAGAYATCNAKVPDTTAMDIDFGTPAGEAVCSLASVEDHPGKPGFVTAEYSDITDFVEAAIPCIGLPATPAPSLAQTSASIVEPDGTVRTYHSSHLDGMEINELMNVAKSLGANTKDIKAAFASYILKMQGEI